MRAKDYLKSLKRLDTVINQKMQEIEDLRLRATQSAFNFGYSEERVQSSHPESAPFVNAVCRIMELEKEIDAEISRFVVERHTIINLIQRLKDPRCIDILYRRYVQFKSLETIAVEMNYTYQYVRQLHGRALQDFESSYKNLLESYINMCYDSIVEICRDENIKIFSF